LPLWVAEHLDRRARLDFGSPAASVTVAKARRVVAAATDWALRHGGLEQPMRFDVVAVDLSRGAPRFELLRGAFDAAGAPM
jgi:putative endonuclease